MDKWIPLVSAVLGSSVLSIIITNWFNKAKTTAEAEDTSAKAMTQAISGSVGWADAMRQDIEFLRSRLDDLMIKYTDVLSKYQLVLEDNHKLRSKVDFLTAELHRYENKHVNS